jgi:hypothetical protein
MNRWDERPDDARRARLELIKALHRKSLLDHEDAKPATTTRGCPLSFEWSVTLPLWHIDEFIGWGVHPIAY